MIIQCTKCGGTLGPFDRCDRCSEIEINWRSESDYRKLQAENEKLKAELDETFKNKCGWQDKATTYKNHADKLAEALERLLPWIGRGNCCEESDRVDEAKLSLMSYKEFKK